MAATVWLSGFGNSMLQATLTVSLPRCGRNRVDHFFCELPVLFKLACVDTSANDAKAFAFSVIFLLLPLDLIMVSYGYIVAVVLRILLGPGQAQGLQHLRLPPGCGVALLRHGHFHVSTASVQLLPGPGQDGLPLLWHHRPHAELADLHAEEQGCAQDSKEVAGEAILE
ncbi:unnamed protein product [Natator depressus]